MEIESLSTSNSQFRNRPMVVQDPEARKQRILLKRQLAKEENNDQQEIVAKDEEQKISEVNNTEEEVTQEEKKPKLDMPDSRTLISNVYRYLQQEYKFIQLHNGGNSDLLPLAAIHQRTAEATGVHHRVVRNIVKEERAAISKRRGERNQRINSNSASAGANNDREEN